MKLKYPVVGQVTDVDDALWDVREVRDTKHGFDLLFGSPVSRIGLTCTGLPRLIATQPLYDFWEANRTKHDGLIYDLPAGRSTLKRVRRRLGFHYRNDVSEFWNEHLEELKMLTNRQFAARHNLHQAIVADARVRLLGRQARALNWWCNPEPLELLRSDLTLKKVGEKLSISISQAHRLRGRARLPQAA